MTRRKVSKDKTLQHMQLEGYSNQCRQIIDNLRSIAGQWIQSCNNLDYPPKASENKLVSLYRNACLGLSVDKHWMRLLVRSLFLGLQYQNEARNSQVDSHHMDTSCQLSRQR